MSDMRAGKVFVFCFERERDGVCVWEEEKEKERLSVLARYGVCEKERLSVLARYERSN